MSMCAIYRGTDPASCIRPRIDPDLCLTPSKPFHNMQLALWLISSLPEQLKCQHSASLLSSHHRCINDNANCKTEVWVVCVCFSTQALFMIWGVYGWGVALRSEWSQRPTAGWCPAHLLFQLRFNAPRWSNQLPTKTCVIIRHCLKSARIRHQIKIFFVGDLSGVTLAFDLDSLHMPIENYCRDVDQIINLKLCWIFTAWEGLREKCGTGKRMERLHWDN